MTAPNIKTVPMIRRRLICLACDSIETAQSCRVLICRHCEIVYFVPSVQLAAQMRAAS